MNTQEYNTLISGSLLIMATVCVTIALSYTSKFLIPFVLALFLFYLITPLISWLVNKLKFPKWLAIVSSFTVIGVVFSILIPFLGGSITTFIKGADVYLNRVINLLETIFVFFEKYKINFGQQLIVDTIKNMPIVNWASSLVGNAASLVTTSFLVLVFLFFMLVGTSVTTERRGIWEKIGEKVERYLVTKVITSLVTGILVGSILAFLGLELAVVFGVLAFFLNFIPTVGSIIATLLPMPIAFLQFSNPLLILFVFLLPFLVQLVIGNFIEPAIMGDHLDLHPVTILCALVFWGMIWGVSGMLMAAPMTAVLKIICDRFHITQPVGEILAGRLPSGK